MAVESLAELRDWLFLLLLCLTLLAEMLELAAAAVAMEAGEDDGTSQQLPCPPVCRCDEGFVYCNDRGLGAIPPLPLAGAVVLYLQSNRLRNAGLPPSLERSAAVRVVYLYANQLDDFPLHLPPSLRELHLQDNNIRTLPRATLARYPALERLHLDDNSISTVSIQERAFSGTPRLRLLFLSRNHLSTIPAGLPASLEELRLDDNRITTVPTHAFRGLAALRRLVLDGNLLANTRIADDTFARLANLTELSLARNTLAAPPVNLPAAHLQRLQLQDNGLTHVPRGALDGMRRLQRLDLSGNNLTTLPRGLLRDADGLELLLARGNPWRCGCNLRWLHGWLRARGAAVTARGLVCAAPEAARGQALRELAGPMEQCEGGGITAVGVGRGGDGMVDSVPGDPTAAAAAAAATRAHRPPTTPQGSLFTLRGPKRPFAGGGEGAGHAAAAAALELAVKRLSADSALVTWLFPRSPPPPSFRLSWLRLGSGAALGSITETLVPGERRQYLLTHLTPRSHYLVCLLPLPPANAAAAAGSAHNAAADTDTPPACAQMETGEASPPPDAEAEGGGEGRGDLAANVFPLAGVIGGATALVSLLLIFAIFCWYSQRLAAYETSSGDSAPPYGRGQQRGAAATAAAGKHYADYGESGTKKDTSVLEIRTPGFQMTPMMAPPRPLHAKLEDVTYVHTIFPSHANGTYRSGVGVGGGGVGVGGHGHGSLNGTLVSQAGNRGYGTNRGYREGGIPDVDYAYT